MKVLSVIVSLDPELGGTQAAATQIIRATQRAGVSNTVVTAATPAARERAATYVRRLEAEGVQVEQFPAVTWLPGADKLGVSFAAMRWLVRRAGAYDLVHVHGVWGLSLLAALAASRLRGVPVVVTPHESLTAIDIETSQNAIRQRVKLALRALYLRWTTAFVVNSQLEADTSVPELSAERVNVAYHPIVDGDSPATQPPPRGAGERLRVGFLGRLHPKKNLDLVIDAIATLPDHVELVVAGGGDLLEQMQRHAERRGVQGRVEWLGFVSPDQRAQFLDGIDVLVMPSTFESFGMSAAEAMLDGVPVIVSEPTGIAEVIRRHEGAGLVVPPDVQSVAAAIQGLDGDRGSLAGLALAGQRAVREELSLERVGTSLRGAYERALARGAA